MGYWFCFLAIGIPFLVFSATPASSRWWRMGRTLLAFIIGYGLTLIWFYIGYTNSYAIHGRTVGAWFIWGTLLTLSYIGWWEFFWRIKYRHTLISIRRGLGDDWINGKLLIIGFFGTLLLWIIFIIPMSLMILEDIDVIDLPGYKDDR